MVAPSTRHHEQQRSPSRCSAVHYGCARTKQWPGWKMALAVMVLSQTGRGGGQPGVVVMASSASSSSSQQQQQPQQPHQRRWTVPWVRFHSVPFASTKGSSHRSHNRNASQANAQSPFVRFLRTTAKRWSRQTTDDDVNNEEEDHSVLDTNDTNPRTIHDNMHDTTPSSALTKAMCVSKTSAAAATTTTTTTTAGGRFLINLPFISTVAFRNVGESVRRMASDPAVSKVILNTLQWGLLLYLAIAIGQTVSDVIQEIASSTQPSDFGVEATTTPFVARKQELERVLDILLYQQQHQQSKDKASITITEKKSPTIDATLLMGNGSASIMSIYHLARRLHACGLPLRTQSSSPRLPSVESLLLSLTKPEAALLQQCLWTPSAATTTATTTTATVGGISWNRIAGLDTVKTQLRRSMERMFPGNTTPASHTPGATTMDQRYAPLFFDSDETSTTTMKGILLYGPPGCGKSLLIQTLASHLRIPCCILTPSTFLRKYVGDTNQMVRTLFTLAQKMAPCCLVLDEIDGLFRERSSDEHQVHRDLKTEFLQWWDGMLSSLSATSTLGPQGKILIVGATNRPFDVDPAVLRRLPESYYIGLPCEQSRLQLLQLLLSKVPTCPGINLQYIAAQTQGYTPSDLKQLLQTASLHVPYDRLMCTQHVIQAMEQCRPTPLSASYRAALQNFGCVSSQSPTSSWNAAAATDPLLFSQSTETWFANGAHFLDAGTVELQPFDSSSSTTSSTSSTWTPPPHSSNPKEEGNEADMNDSGNDDDDDDDDDNNNESDLDDS